VSSLARGIIIINSYSVTHERASPLKSTLGAFTNDLLESRFRGQASALVYDVSRLEIHTRCIYKRRSREQIPGVYLRVYTTSHGSKYTLGAFTNDVLESKFRACFCACIRRLTARNTHSVHLQTTFWRANSGRVFARVYDVSRLKIHTQCIYKRRFGEQIPGVYLRVYTTSHGSKFTLSAFTNDVLENKFR